MTTTSRRMTIALLVLVSAPAFAAERMQAGQWSGTTTVGGRTYPTSSCITQGDADAMNGDARSIGAYLAKIIPPEACSISGIKAQDGVVVYSAACGGAPAKVITTSYHGDSSEGSDTTGARTEAKRIGPCT